MIAMDLVAAEDHALVAARRGGPRRPYEIAIVRPDGTRVPVQIATRQIRYGVDRAHLISL